MEPGSICIRKACFRDADNLFWLLHSESIPWNTSQINANISSVYVMTYEGKLIGATCYSAKGGHTEILWTAIHPMYPEKALSDILHDSLAAISARSSSHRLKFCSE